METIADNSWVKPFIHNLFSGKSENAEEYIEYYIDFFKELFKDAREENGNVILLLDEVDSLASRRSSDSNNKEKNNTLN